MITKTIKKYKPVVGMTSLVGISSTDYPLRFGNYCSISDGPYLINMWAENLREAKKEFSLEEIEVTVFSDGKHSLGIVTDERVPKEWLNNKTCVTGHGWGSRELCETVLQFLKLPILNHLCGCEKQDESRSISHSWNKEKGEIYHCHKCGNEWEPRI